jgi:hypothetical protein
MNLRQVGYMYYYFLVSIDQSLEDHFSGTLGQLELKKNFILFGRLFLFSF